MASVIPRRISKKAMSLTATLERLRHGPASITLPRELKEVEMTFAARNRDYGARKFLKYDVPSLLYVNPTLSVKQNRPERVEDPVMVLRYNNGSTQTIHLKQKNSELIREEFKEVVQGTLPDNISEPIRSTPTPSSQPSSEPPTPSPTDSGQSSGGTESASEVGEEAKKGKEGTEAGQDYGTARE